jgi:hypothetical protein
MDSKGYRTNIHHQYPFNSSEFSTRPDGSTNLLKIKVDKFVPLVARELKNENKLPACAVACE